MTRQPQTRLPQTRLPLTPLAQSLPATVPFVGPETLARRRGRPFRARIGANESVFGPSPRAVEAMAREAAESWKYCDPENYELKVAFADHVGVKPENIIAGEGIDALLGYIVRLFVDKGDAVVTSDGAYPTFAYHAVGFGGNLIRVPYRDDREDGEALIAAAKRENAALVYLANPDNPMGTWSDGASLQSLFADLPPDTMFCLDEAYIDYAPEGTAPPIDVSNPQVVRFRTFSKIYGMAGLRVGYAIAHEDVVAACEKVRNHFGINRVAQAGSIAAIADQDHVRWVGQETDKSKVRIAEIAAGFGLTTLPSATSFVAMDCGQDGAFAKQVLDGLLERDIFIRMPAVAPLNRCIRVSAGSLEDLDLFAAALEDTLQTVKSR